MRSMKSGLIVVAMVAAGVGFASVGCSADGSGGAGDPQPAASATTDPNQPGTSNDGNQPNRDAGTKPKDAGRDTSITPTDSGTRDAVAEAGNPEYPAGTACATPNATNRVSCGVCGYKDQVCLPNAEGGGNAWTAAGFCQNEVVGGCTPGQTRSTPCGLCGTQTDTCSAACTWPTTGTCAGQPANACNPGTKEFAVGLGCTLGPNSGRERLCDSMCLWGNYSATCLAAPNNPLTMNVPALNQTASSKFTLAAANSAPRSAIGSCPTTGSLGTSVPTTCVELKNTTAAAVTVSAWNSTAAGGTALDTVMSAYNGPVIPTTDPARKNCVGYVADLCDVAPCDTSGSGDWAGLTSTTVPPHPVAIAANSSVIICTQSYFSTTVGDFMLNVRREQ